MDDTRKQREHKTWEELDITDNFIFCHVMRDEKLCKELLERLLSIEIDRIEYLNSEQEFDIDYDAKSVRLDVYVKDSNRVFDSEMQTKVNKHIPKRMRYYQAIMDMDILTKGKLYSDLKESYILFICTNDPLGEKLPKYTIENRCVECPNVNFDDGTHRILYNAEAYINETNEKIKDILGYIDTGKTESEFTKQLEESVNKVKSNGEWRRKYMSFDMILMEEKQEAREEGREEGSYSTKIEFARTMLSDGESLDKIQRYTHLSLAEIQALQ